MYITPYFSPNSWRCTLAISLAFCLTCSACDDDAASSSNPSDQAQAGEIQAGEIIENCGLYSEASIQIFTQAPLDLLTNSCANCHNPESFRRFKLTFDSSDVDTTYSPEQVQEALNSIEPFIIIGNGVGSLLATRIIDGHSNLNFNANAPEYSQMVTWIDSLINCN